MKTIAKNLLKALARILLFPLVFGLFGQASCSKEDKIDPDDPIVGTWRMDYFYYSAEMDIEEVTGVITGIGRDMDNVLITFNADGTTSHNGRTFIVEETIMLAGHSTTTRRTTQPIIQNGTWEIRGNTLIVDRPGVIAPLVYPIEFWEDGNVLSLDAPQQLGFGPVTSIVSFRRVS